MKPKTRDKCLQSFLPFLGILFLSYYLPAQTFKTDSLAVRAILDSNRLTTKLVDEVIIAENGRITEIFLYLDSIKILPQQIGKLTELKRLYLMFNSLTAIPPDIRYCTKLEEVYLGNNFLRSLPDEFAELKNLRILELASNALEYLPAGISAFTRLDTIDLRYNNFTSLPAELCACTTLTAFFCGNNAIEFLPDQLGNLTGIKSLDVKFNKLTTLPASITKSAPTDFCDLGYNKLGGLDPAIVAWADRYDPDWKSTQEHNAALPRPGARRHHNALMLRGASTVSYTLPCESDVRISVYGIDGAPVHIFANKTLAAGTYAFSLASLAIAPGEYIVVAKNNQELVTRKVVLYK